MGSSFGLSGFGYAAAFVGSSVERQPLLALVRPGSSESDRLVVDQPCSIANEHEPTDVCFEKLRWLRSRHAEQQLVHQYYAHAGVTLWTKGGHRESGAKWGESER